VVFRSPRYSGPALSGLFPHYSATPPLRTPAALNLMIGNGAKLRIVAAKI
jgi:hypothetical protein